MKTRILFFCLVLFLAGFMMNQACKPKERKPLIGLLMDQFNVERWSKDTAFFIKAVQEMGGEVICLAANGNPDKQLDQAKALIKKGAEVLVVVPVDLKQAAEIVNVALKASRHVISYDRMIQNSFVDYYISFDNIKVGELQADYIRKRLEKGNIALIGGPPSDQNSNYLKFGQMGILQPYIERGDIKVVYTTMVKNWSFEEGYKAALECLKGKKVDAIIAGNDLLASGAIKALEERGLSGKVLVAGQDADKEARENIVKGVQTVTVYKPIESLARNAARMAMDLANGNRVDYATSTINNGLKMVPSLLLNPTLVNKGNIGLEVTSGQAR